MPLNTQNIVILAIESSCDETSAAVIYNGKMLSNIVASQIIHEQHGGVVRLPVLGALAAGAARRAGDRTGWAARTRPTQCRRTGRGCVSGPAGPDCHWRAHPVRALAANVSRYLARGRQTYF